MKNLVKVVLSLFIMTAALFAQALEHSGEKDGYVVKFTSEKPLVVGNNEVFVTLMQDNEIVQNAQVKIKVFMPEMPGMPYMDYQAKTKFVDDRFVAQVNFSMSGTWQYHIKFRTDDGKVHTLRGSVNL
ncbi:MAG: FixH family protein [Arcobacteraceae bacterium]